MFYANGPCSLLLKVSILCRGEFYRQLVAGKSTANGRQLPTAVEVQFPIIICIIIIIITIIIVIITIIIVIITIMASIMMIKKGTLALEATLAWVIWKRIVTIKTSSPKINISLNVLVLAS